MGRIALVLLVSLLSACQTSPPQVMASRNLVEQVTPSNGKESIPEELYSAVANEREGRQIVFRHSLVELQGFYTSALGTLCRKVRILPEAQMSYVRIACRQSDGTWMLEPNVLYGGDETLFSASSAHIGATHE